jgi:hypothetical protein
MNNERYLQIAKENDLCLDLYNESGTFFNQQQDYLATCAAIEREVREEIASTDYLHPQVPEGKVLVPIEPTDKMIAAAHVHYESCEYTGIRSTYKAMIAASEGVK